MQAMILAAGFGTRLKPYTDHKPKPLFPVLNTPLLSLAIDKLKKAGFNKIIINCHYLSEQLVELLKDISGVVVQTEDIILGTGGGLRKALINLDDEPLLVVNGDIYHNICVEEMYRQHSTGNADVTMALHDFSRFNKVNVEEDKVVGFGLETPNKLAFTGVHVISPDVLEEVELGKFSCIIDRYKELLAQNKDIEVYRVDNSYWSDMGTPEDYLKLHADIFRGDAPFLDEQFDFIENNLIVGTNTNLSETTVINDWACIGSNVQIGNNVEITRSVVWNNAVLQDGSKYIDTIVI